jgi:uracil phosphoribosyltransferase
MALAVEATKALPLKNTSVETVLGKASAQRIDDEIVVVPILRAGLGMLEPILTLLPTARVGYIGLERDEQTAIASSYYSKLPDQIASAHTLLVDPMLATGGSAVAALDLLSGLGVSHAVLLSIVATDQGIRAVEEHHSQPTIYTAAVDPTLNEQKYIVPGLGDFGDRLYGTD